MCLLVAPVIRQLSSGVHKFTVINYGKVTERPRIRSSGDQSLHEDICRSTLSIVDVPNIQVVGTSDQLTAKSCHSRFLSSRLKLEDTHEIDEGHVDSVQRHSMETYLTVDETNKNIKFAEVAKRGRLFAKRKKKRLVYQNGECNISYVNVEKRSARYLLDIFTTLLELRWSYNILVYLIAFVSSWLLFALMWWAIHAGSGVGEDGRSCIEGVDSFQTALLFSIETQHTIGYGTRVITDRCPLATMCLMLQSVFGAVMQCLVTGIIFAKVARPNKRAETVIFSKKAVICREYSSLCLSFRVADMRNSQLIGVNINALLVRKKKINNDSHSTVDLYQETLKIATESGDDFFFLAWPLKIVHRIDETSPLWNLSPELLLVSDFEILVVLEANCEATGATTQVRTSYLPSDILWGHVLAPLLTYQKDNGRYKVDYSQFNSVLPVDTPEMSAKDILDVLPPCPPYAALQLVDELTSSS